MHQEELPYPPAQYSSAQIRRRGYCQQAHTDRKSWEHGVCACGGGGGGGGGGANIHGSTCSGGGGCSHGDTQQQLHAPHQHPHQYQGQHQHHPRKSLHTLLLPNHQQQQQQQQQPAPQDNERLGNHLNRPNSYLNYLNQHHHTHPHSAPSRGDGAKQGDHASAAGGFADGDRIARQTSEAGANATAAAAVPRRPVNASAPQHDHHPPTTKLQPRNSHNPIPPQQWQQQQQRQQEGPQSENPGKQPEATAGTATAAAAAAAAAGGAAGQTPPRLSRAGAIRRRSTMFLVSPEQDELLARAVEKARRMSDTVGANRGTDMVLSLLGSARRASGRSSLQVQSGTRNGVVAVRRPSATSAMAAAVAGSPASRHPEVRGSSSLLHIGGGGGGGGGTEKLLLPDVGGGGGGGRLGTEQGLMLWAGNKSRVERARLAVRLLQATDLGRSKEEKQIDPYAVVSCEGKSYTSKAVMKSKDPFWDEFFVFDVPQPAFAELKVKVYDHLRCWRPGDIFSIVWWKGWRVRMAVQDDSGQMPGLQVGHVVVHQYGTRLPQMRSWNESCSCSYSCSCSCSCSYSCSYSCSCSCSAAL
ncbi:hypothetical protein VOLCADRAFT_119783 [Volvox carteri f. nagariensis]|uniref:C2 domain-containing protein n=1 Tax=Volvox carteri f. nagariensis TaxID=3068 RepID=D8UGL3_VOLCA|nr:uncharacterized protein VOLCADRAFT_119783 [Volvox carteri f. nagariensis]EFJ41143.1 hypothetical protein VOLCADRAFT_119783 [Volvox carteri f. nagariensis]|eukprot:XP_002957815.1 hypothetical protein VOLCADRAFT_119783 [Volvox carteri f. nagariensis]